MTTQALALPDEGQFRADFQAITRFQAIVHSQMIAGHDFGVIPGSTKPTLLKPGAEKIVKLLHLADTYEIVDQKEDWEKGFFRFLIRCRLTHITGGVVVSEGLGECNSMESKYRWRWLWPDDVPPGVDHTTLVSRPVRGGGKQYRFPNDDIYTQVNTLLKMAKKRALVDAALSAGRLSDIFTQDVEDTGQADNTPAAPVVTTPSAMTCPVHNVEWFKRGRMKDFAHPVDGGKWCNKADVEQAQAQKQAEPVVPTEEDLGYGGEGGVVDSETRAFEAEFPAGSTPQRPQEPRNEVPAAVAIPGRLQDEVDYTYFFRAARAVAGLSPTDALKKLGVGNWNNWLSAGHTLEDALKRLKE